MGPTLADYLSLVAHAAETEYEEDLPGLDAAGLAVLAQAIRSCRADLATLLDRVKADLAAQMPARKMTVEHLGEVTRKKGMRRTGWDHERLLPAVVSRITDEPATLYDLDTGALLPYATIGHNIARRLGECVSFGGGKVTGLKAIGIDPADYCVEEPEAVTVELPPRPAI